MNTILLDIWLMRILNGKHSRMITTFWLYTKARMLTFLHRGTSLKMCPLGIIKLSMYMERLVL